MKINRCMNKMLIYLQKALDSFSRGHDDRCHDTRYSSGDAQLCQVEFLIGRFLLQSFSDAEAHEAQGEDGRHAYYGGSHTWNILKPTFKVLTFE